MALGDVRGDEQFDYLSIDDFRIIRNQLFENKKRSTKDRYPIPFAIFTDPPLAHIGLTEEEAMKNGYSIHVARIPAAMIPRARTLHSIDGMLKAIVDIHTGRILGCTTLCRCTGSNQYRSINHENGTVVTISCGTSFSPTPA